MPSRSHTLTITECPECGKSHEYQLEVTRSAFLYNTLSSGLYSERTQKPSWTKRYFTRLFTCPVTGEDFQGRFWIAERFPAEIESVEVSGLVTESTDEQENA